MITRFLLLLLTNALLFWIIDTTLFMERITVNGGYWGYFFVGTVFALVNIFLKPALKLITLPIRWLTLGLLNLALNAVLLWISVLIVNLFSISNIAIEIVGIGTFFFAGLLLGLCNYIFSLFRN